MTSKVWLHEGRLIIAHRFGGCYDVVEVGNTGAEVVEELSELPKGAEELVVAGHLFARIETEHGVRYRRPDREHVVGPLPEPIARGIAAEPPEHMHLAGFSSEVVSRTVAWSEWVNAGGPG